MQIEVILLVTALLLLLSILVSKLGGRLGLPGLLLFLLIGMLAGSEGPGGIPYDDYQLEEFIGTVALCFILFQGGLETSWRRVRPVLGAGLLLATVGVLLTTGLLAAVAHLLFNLSALESLLLGAVVSSTDASAVFSVLKERALGLKGQIRPLLELESGINDPTAVFLTVGLTSLILHPERSGWSILPGFVLQMGLGLILGLLLGRASVWLINTLRLSSEGLYAVLTLTLALLIYGLTTVLGGSGFLALYVAGAVLGSLNWLHKRTVLQFFAGVSYLMELGLFLTLGLLVFPSQLLPLALPALLLGLFLIVLARPLAVFLSLLPIKMPNAHKSMVAWVGLRGAVPVVLATIPLLEGVPGALLIFNVAFFIVLTSLLIQGSSLSFFARLLGVREALPASHTGPLEYTPTGAGRNDLLEVEVPHGSSVLGRPLVELNLPEEALIVLIHREGEYLIPRGSSTLEAGDRLQVLGRKAELAELFSAVLERAPTRPENP